MVAVYGLRPSLPHHNADIGSIISLEEFDGVVNPGV